MNLITAFEFAHKAHDGQLRKGSKVPYISHPMAVAAIVLQHGGSEQQAMAALLHDTIEDCGATYLQLKKKFGELVATIVEECSDWSGSGRKPKWRARKEFYIARLATVRDETLLVSAADKFHNSATLLESLEAAGVDLSRREKIWSKFNAKPHEILWYYEQLFEQYSKRAEKLGEPGLTLLLDGFEQIVAKLSREIP